MSLLQRKPRPLRRDADTLRDDRLFIVACDDTYAPQQYFDFFKITRVQVHVVPATQNDSHAVAVLSRLKQIAYEEDDQRWMLLDTDHCTQREHLKNFTCALQDAAKAGVQVALSKPCFELWLLLHHIDAAEMAALSNAKQVEARLEAQLGKYDKTRLVREHFPLEAVALACRRAQALDEGVDGGDIPSANTSRVYRLWQEIIDSALPSQLPPELRQLRRD